MIYYITGGERSGKSAYAEKLALSLSDTPKYVATSRIWDEGHKARIEDHKKGRSSQWINVEEEKELSKVITEGDVALIDCVTLWLTNFFFDNDSQVAIALEQAKKAFENVLSINATLIFVSNEIGMGGHATTEVGRKFTELQGWMNQHIAKHADKATFMVSGLPLTLKE